MKDFIVMSHHHLYFLVNCRSHEKISWPLLHCINPFHATGLFLYPLKTSENLWFSNVFGGRGVYRMVPVVRNCSFLLQNPQGSLEIYT